MLRLLPILLVLLYGYVVYRFSARRLSQELDANSTELDDPILGSLCKDFATALDVPRIRVFVHEVDAINGMAAPDGRIFITRGFYRKFQAGEVSDAELASVIAHELGHVALGHTRRRMIDFSGQNALRTALAMVIGRFLPGVGVYIANLLTSLIAARLSRTDEYEADAYAAALMSKAGLGTAPQKQLFEKLDALTKSNRGAMPAWFLSHPKPQERIAAIETLEKRWNVPATPPNG